MSIIIGRYFICGPCIVMETMIYKEESTMVEIYMKYLPNYSFINLCGKKSKDCFSTPDPSVEVCFPIEVSRDAQRLEI